MSSVSTTMSSYEDPIRTYRFPKPDESNGEFRRRKRSRSSHSTAPSYESENIHQLLDGFLAELSSRLEFLETYGHVQLDHGMKKAYATLHAVRDSCSLESDNFIGAGRRRASVFIDTLDKRYKGAIERKASMESNVQQSVKLLSQALTDLESKAYARRDSAFAVATEYANEGRLRVNSGINRARKSVDYSLRRASLAKDHLKYKIELAVTRARKHGLISYEDLPEPWRVNPHITAGYRFNVTKLDCFYSLGGMSNEFVNIWSHLIGLILVGVFAFYIYPATKTFSASTASDVTVALLFFGAAAKCLICSTLWHTMCSISDQPLMERFACVDYSGISLLVATSIVTTEWAAFYCEPVSRWSYICLTLVLGVIGSILPWHPIFNRTDLSWLRVCFFCGLAATGFIPIFQLIWTRGIDWAIYFYAPIAKSLAVYLGGSVLYAKKIPEKWYPGMFNYFGGSHNIWHFAVLGGIYYHYHAMHNFFHFAFQRMVDGSCPA